MSDPIPTNPISGRIAYITGEYPRATDTYIQREVAGLRALGFDVVTASARDTGAEHLVGPEQIAEKARTFQLLSTAKRPGKLIAAHLRALRSPGRYLRALRLAWSAAPPGLKGRAYNLIYFIEGAVLARWMQDNGVVHIHCHIAKQSCNLTMIAAAQAGVRYSFTLHGPDDLWEPEYWKLGRKVAGAAFVSCISDFCRGNAMFFSARQHWDKLHVIHCGVDPSRYDRPRPARGARLVFAGRLAAVKGIPILYQALAAVRARRPDVHVTLIGDGPERRALESEAQAMGLADCITFAGYKGQGEVAAIMAQSDALVLPSFAEGVPVVLMEAMAARLPVVVSRVAGVPELVEDGVSGFLTPPGNPGPLADAILAALDADPAMGEAGRAKVVAEFDSRIEAARLGRLFVAADRGGARPGRRPDPL